ncbi:MAG: tetratricopeptide repeat protein [Bryobacteraceae bacterium]
MRSGWTIALLMPLVLGASEETLEQRVRRITAEAAQSLGAGEFPRCEALAESAWRLALDADPQRPDFAEGVQIAADFDFWRGLEKRGESRVRNALARAESSPVSRVKLSLVLSNRYFSGGQYLDALPVLEQSLRTAENGPSRRYLGQVVTMLAQAYEATGRLGQAEEALRRKRDLKPDDVWQSMSLTPLVGTCGFIQAGLNARPNELADFLLRTGRKKAAEEELRRAAAIAPAAGSSLADRVDGPLALYSWLSHEGRYAEAETVERQLRRIASETPDDQGQPLERIQLSITFARMAQNRRAFSKAATLYTEVFREAERQFGGSGPEYWQAYLAYSGFLRETGNASESEELSRRHWQHIAITTPTPAAPHPPVPPAPAPPEPPPAPFSQTGVNLRLSSGASIDEVLRLLEPARSHYPNLLLNVVSNGTRSQPDQASRFLRMQQELVESYFGPGAQLPILRAQIELSRDDDRLQREHREQQFHLIENLKGSDALELLAEARELAKGWEKDDWPRAMGYWRNALRLSEHWRGVSSHEHASLLAEFADSAAWADQVDVARKALAEAIDIASRTRSELLPHLLDRRRALEAQE